MQQHKERSLALYVHWPFCKSKCPYCDFNSHVREKIAQGEWRRALLAELEWTAKKLGPRRLTSIFFGGGTPSLMEPSLVADLIDAASKHWSFAPDIEITLEANPTSVEAKKLEDFKTAGVNRVSLGVQALHQGDLKFLGREHSVKEALAAVELAGNLFDRMSFDLIYARPLQTVERWKTELNEALKYARGHLSLYQLTIEENTAFYHAYHARKSFALPEEENAADLYEATQEVMDKAGMPAYEISNHAIPGEESRHNLAYWRGMEYAGIGPGAHGRIMIDGTRHATTTLKSPEMWLEAVKKNNNGLNVLEPIERSVLIEEVLMMSLRVAEGIDAARFESQTGTRLKDAINLERAEKLVNNGLITLDDMRLRPTQKGMMLMNYVLGELVS